MNNEILSFKKKTSLITSGEKNKKGIKETGTPGDKDVKNQKKNSTDQENWCG